MNKVYKVIWSKVRGCYVVVSEIAKSGGKTKARHEKKSSHGGLLVAAALAASVYGAGESGHVEAATGTNAVQEGTDAAASGANSIAIGPNAKASADSAIAIGNGASASADSAIAVGKNAVAAGQGAFVIGEHNSATGQNAVAFGGGYGKNEKGNTASAVASVAFGENTVAKAEGAVAFGYGTQAGSDQTDTNGKNYGQDAVAFGNGTKALGGRSLAFGERTLAEYTNSVAFGADTQSRSNGATAFGSRTRAMAQYSTAFGNRAIAAGNYATAFGTDTLAGVKTDSSGAMLLTNGTKIDANGNVAYTDASGNTYAVKNFQNVKNGQPSGEIHDYVVVKGTDGNNYIQDYHGDIHAVTLTTQDDGTIVATASTDIAKNITLQTATATSTAGYDFVGYNNATAFGESTKAINKNATALGENSVASGENSLAFGEGSTASGNNSVAGLGGTASTANSIAIGKDTKANNTTENAVSVAIGQEAEASGARSLAIGFGVKGKNADGTEDTVLTQTTASGESAVSIGTDTKAAGQHALAMGSHTEATKDSSVAIGYDTHATEASTVAIGSGTKVNRGYGVAIGLSALAGIDESDPDSSGATSHDGSQTVAVGYYTRATAFNATALGTSASANVESSVALGYGASTTRAAGNKVNGAVQEAYLKPTSVDSSNSTWTSTAGAVSVGNASAKKSITRQITDVAAGSLDTDAVNVAQLKAAGVTVTSNDNSVGIEKTTDATDHHINYDLKVAAATLTNSNGTVISTNPKAADGTTENTNAYVTGNSVANAINNSGFTLTTSKSAGEVSGTTSELINPGETVTFDAGKNIALTQATNKITIATKDHLDVDSVTYTTKDANDNTKTYTTQVNGTGINVTPNETDSKKKITLTQDGLSNGGKQIINQASGASAITGEGDNKAYTYDNDTNGANIGDVKRLAGEQTLNYTGDNNTKGSNKLSESIAFNGKENQIVTTAEDGKLGLKLADDVKGLNSITAGNARMGHNDAGTLDTVQNGAVTGKQAEAGDYVTGLTNKDWTVKNPTYVSGRAATEDELKTVSDAVTNNTDNINTNTNNIQVNADNIAKGLSFTTNTKDAQNTTGDYQGYKVVNRKLGDTISIKAGDAAADHKYSTTNLTTDIDNTGNITIKMDDNPTFNTVNATSLNLQPKDNTTKDQNGHTATAQLDAHYRDASLNSSKNVTMADGTTGMTRLHYHDGEGTIHDLATMDDGQVYAGDIKSDGTADTAGFGRTMNQKTTIKGGVTDQDNLSDNNIGVVSNGTDTLTVKLAKNLTGLTSVTTGKTKVENSGLTITNDVNDSSKNVIVNGDKIAFGGNQVTNMGSGSDGTDANGNPTYNTTTNGANIGDVQKIANSTVKSVTDTVNAGWELDYNGTKLKDVTPTSRKANFAAGQNISLTGSDDTITVATADDVRFNTVRVGGTKSGDTYSGGIVIGTQSGGSSANPNTDYYITGLKNTNWDSDKIQSGRAATEDQLKAVADNIKQGTVAGDVYLTGGGIKYNGEHDDKDTTSVNDGKGSLKLTLKNQSEPISIDGLHDYYITDGAVSEDGKTLTLTRNDTDSDGNHKTISVKLDNLEKNDLHLVANPTAGSDGKYTVASDGTVTLTVQNDAGTTSNNITIGGLASKTDGLNFGANAKVNDSDSNPVTNKLNSTVNIKGAGKKALSQYSGQNLMTSVEQADDGTTTINVLMDKDISTDTVMVTGKDGNNGQIGITGKNGTNGTVTTIIKTVGANGTDGTNGTPGVDGTNITRVVYQDGVDGTDGITPQTVATLNDGLKFAGDDNTVITKKLNEQLNFVGGADKTKLTENNIGINEGEDGKLHIQLVNTPNLGTNGNLTAGTAQIGWFSDANNLFMTNGTSQTGNKATAGSYVVGLSNTDWNVTSPEYVSGRAATEDQLKKLSDALKNSDAVDTDYQLVPNPDSADNHYKAVNGTVTLKVKDKAHPDAEAVDVVIDDIASKSTVDAALDRTVKYNIDNTTNKVDKNNITLEGGDAGTQIQNMASGASAVTTDDSGNKTYTYDTDTNAANIGDVKRLAGQGDLNYAGDTGKGTNKLSDAVKFTGTKDQITTSAKNGEVNFKLADDIRVGQKGADGSVGVDGSIGANGKDGSSVVLNGADGSIGLKGTDGANGLTIRGDNGAVGVDGTDGKDGKDGMTRIVYKDDKGTDHAVATLNDGLKFVGNDGQEVTRALNSTFLSLKGGLTGDALQSASSKNLGVRKNSTNDGLEVVMTDTPDFTKVTIGGGTDTTKKIVIGEQTNGKKTETGKYITGLDNTTWDKDNIVENRAATEGQLHDIAGSITNQANGGGFALASEEKDSTGNHLTVKQDLGKAIELKGDTTYKADGSVDKPGNIKTSVDNGSIKISLNKDVDLGPGGSVKTGATTINNAGVTTNKVQVGDISITKDGINGGSKQISNIASGLDGKSYDTTKDGQQNWNNAASIGDVHTITSDIKQNVTNVTDKVDKMDQHIGQIDQNVTQLQQDVHADRQYQGDDAAKGKLNVKFGSFLRLTGGADSNALTGEGNIGVIQQEKDGVTGLSVRLAKHLNLEKTTYATEENGEKHQTEVDSKGLTISHTDASGKANNIVVREDNVSMGGNQIHNVAPGSADDDAVNVSQLKKLGGEVSNVSRRVDRVGAGAAALAALHPQDFDPDDKWDFAVGYGNYRGANAAAVGAFYQPNEDTTLSVGGTVGGGENMINAGISFKFGQGNHVTNSRVAMAKEILALKDFVEKQNTMLQQQNAKIEKLEAMVGAASGTPAEAAAVKPQKHTLLFPDVPENHWAYSYVKKLSERGLLEGYPDGEFKGNRTLTRYEFAAIVARALENGAAADEDMQHMAEEFDTEIRELSLSRFRVDRVAGDDNDRHKIERVRVNDRDEEVQKKNGEKAKIYRDIYGEQIEKAAEAAK
ncbi:ESPR-type extended signal peptide-containing protein [Mitsuokella sp. WILCCON 0060]|uniref:ESPR-type extended signal peptide-containing protein n=1 Tax=Mitsuokella sp. WILCCON 0060 TaxID=3345341 RepID=UPI003F1B0C88